MAYATIKFGDLNTGDLFYYVCNGNPAGEKFRKASPREAVQQRADGSGDLHSIDAVVKTRATTKVIRASWLAGVGPTSKPTYASARAAFGWVVERVDDKPAAAVTRTMLRHVNQDFAVCFDTKDEADALANALNAARK